MSERSAGRIAIVLAAAVLAAAHPAKAEITSISLTVTESPAFGGLSFGTVGQYEKLQGTAYGQVDPNDPANAGIVDLSLAPRNAQGKVEYSTSVYILRPIVRAGGSHELLYEGVNRGSKLMLDVFDVFDSATNTITNGNDPTSAGDAGTGFLMKRGYTLAWSGWDPLVAPVNNAMTMSAPVAVQKNGQPVTGVSLEEFEVDNATTEVEPLTYPAADVNDMTTPVLTVREHYADTPVPVTGWSYASPTSIALAGGAAFTQGRLYELTYTAANPIVEGLGFAATRDLVAFLRHGTATLKSPLGDDIKHAVSFGFSQPGRFFRDFVTLGFNQAEDGSQVFDGIDNYIAAGNGIFLNDRFAQPGRTERQHIARWYPEGLFPFAWQDSHDPISGRTAGRLDACLKTDTCPKIIEAFSENEYWAKAGSLLTTTPDGTADLPPTPYVRFYQFASHQHGSGNGYGICAQPQNPLLPNAGLRALLVAMDDWIRGYGEPPASRVPMLADGTLVLSLPQEGVGFPDIPGVTYNGLKTIRNTYNWGPRLDQGVLTVEPPKYVGAASPSATAGRGIYPSYVPADDADGNNVAGVRMPDVAAPVATFTGWGLQGPSYASGDGCDASGQMLPFPLTQAAAAAAGDPREPISSRYPTNAAYVAAIVKATTKLAREGFLLPDDVGAYIGAAEASPVGTPALTAPKPIAE